MSAQEKIKQIEEEMARTQKNKATSFHLGLLKAKLAKLRKELLFPKGGSTSTEGGFDVQKTGIARVGFIGFPSVGKSTLMSKLTGVDSAVAEYEFTTLTTVPGVVHYNGAKIQILDLPGIIEGAKDGKGRGRQVIAVARTCSMLFVVLDAQNPCAQKKAVERELEGYGIRLNKEPPGITIKKRASGVGGIVISTLVPLTKLTQEMIRSVLMEYKLMNADVAFTRDASIDDLIDTACGDRVYMPCLYVLNKIDRLSIREFELSTRLRHCVPISADRGWGLDLLLMRAWEYMALVRVFTKKRAETPDFTEPVVLKKRRSTVGDLCDALHKELAKDFKYALVWSSTLKQCPQMVGKEHQLIDEDVVQIVKK